MIPTSIPNEMLGAAVALDPETVRRVISPPDGDLTNDAIRPVEALVSRDAATDLAAIRVRLVLEDGELEQLAAGEPVWLTMLGGLAPFDVRVGEHG